MMRIITVLLFLPVLAASAVEYRGLVAHYDFNQDSGSVLKDLSGHGHDGTVSGPAWVAGVEGGALRFDGVNDRVAIPFAPDLNTPEFTLQAWIRTDEKTHDQAIIDRVTPGGERWNYRLMIPSRIHSIEGHPVPPGVVQSDVKDNFTSYWDYIALGRSQVTLGRWKHIAATFKDRHFRIYVDGRLDGEKTVTIDAIDTTRQPMLLGDCAYLPLDFHFRGDMDQVSIWNVALDADSIARMAAAYPTRAPEINVGMKEHFGEPGDTVWVPLYLTNFEGDSVSSAAFSLQFDPDLVSLAAVSVDSGTAKGWTLLDWNLALPDEAKIALGGAPKALGYGEGELLRFAFVIRPDAKAGAATAIDVANVRFDEREDIQITNKPGRITVSGPKPRLGDVDGDGEIDLADAAAVLAYVVGHSAGDSGAPAFSKDLADVSGKGGITSYDAALIAQYAMGLLDVFPAEAQSDAPDLPTAPLAKRASSGAELLLSDPQPLEGNRYLYHLKGRGLKGLVAAEVSFRLGASAEAVESVVSGIAGARLSPLADPQGGRIGVALTTNDDVDEDEVDVLELVVRQHPGQSSPGLELASAFLDEGRLAADGINSRPLAVRPEVAGRSAQAGRLRVDGSDLEVAAMPGEPLTVQAFDLSGRQVFAQSWKAGESRMRIPLAELSGGVMVLRIAQPHSKSTRLFMNPRP